jgi:hypothetical protein
MDFLRCILSIYGVRALGIAAEMVCPERQAIAADSPTRRGTPIINVYTTSVQLQIM